MLKYGETVCCRDYLLLCSSVVFGFRNGADAVVDFSFMGIAFVKGLQLTEIVLLRGSAYGDCFVKGLLGCVRAFCWAGRLLYRDKRLCRGGSCSVFFDMMCVKNVSRQ